jgi:hypothetical protein
MNRAKPQMRSFAKRLLAYETPRREASTMASFHAVDKLRTHLAALMGNGGFRALLSRALALAAAEVSWLRAVHIEADGALQGLEAVQARLEPAEFLEGKVVLLAQLLGLLVTFIGPSLTARLVSEIWPQVSLSDRDFGGDNEKAE